MTYTFFSVMPILVILFWLLLFLLDGSRDKAKGFLMLFLSVSLLNFITHWFYFSNNYEVYKWLNSMWVFTSLSVYPLYYYYIRLLTKDRKIDFRWIWILLPALLLSIFSALLFILMKEDECSIFIQEVLYRNAERSDSLPMLVNLQILRINLHKWIFALEVLMTLYFGSLLIREFKDKVCASFSRVDNKVLHRIQVLLFFLLFTAIISLVSSIIGKSYFIKNSYLLILPSIAHSITFFGIGYVGYKQNFTIRELDKELENDAYPLKEGDLKDREYDLLYQKLEALMVDDKLYLNPELRLSDISELLATNRSYVSRLVNNKSQISFCEFVNDYRIAHAKKDAHL